MNTPMELSFSDLKGDVGGAVDGLITALAFVDKFAGFLPAQYKLILDEFLSLLTMLDSFLDKMP